MPKGRLVVRLFDPGMTHLHQVGLAGLYMTLRNLDPTEYEPWGSWRLDPHTVELYWNRTPSDLLAPIFKASFGISHHGAIDFLGHRAHPMGDLEKLLLHRAILTTYLQHNRTRRLADNEQALSFEFEGQPVHETIKPLINYQNQNAADLLFNAQGGFREDIKLAGWLFPGGAVRHVVHTSTTTLTAGPDKFICLLFAPVCSLYFMLNHRNNDGKFDKRKTAALVLPHITNLESYHRNYFRYLSSPVHRLIVNGLGDAGLTALTTLHLTTPAGMIESLEIDSCTVVTLGTVPWAKQQKTRTGLRVIRHINLNLLNFFELATRTLPNKIRVGDEGKLSFHTSAVRGLIAENIAAGKDWYRDFSGLMSSKKMAGLVSFERKEVHEMVENKDSWSYEADRLLVEAVHQALRNRYGALAQRAKLRGEAPQFGREFERIRTSLMRSKNAQTFRAELADLFARGGLNTTLQDHWGTVLPLFAGPDWQRARDLSLLALASYTGKGIETIEAELETDLGEEE